MSSLPMAVGSKSAIFRYQTLCQCASDSFGAPPLNEGYLPESPQNSSSQAPLILRTFEWRRMATFTVPKQPGPWSICADHGAASNQTSSAQGVSQDFANCAGQDVGSARHCGHIRSLVLYVPTNLLDAIRFSKGFAVVEEEFVMEGVARLAGAPHKPGRYLQHLPTSLQSLTFDDSFDQNLEGVNLPHCLQSLTFGYWFNQLLAKMKLPNSLQSLACGVLFNHSLEAVN